MNCNHSRLACESPWSLAHEVCDRRTRGCSNGLGTVRSDSKHTEEKACCQILTLGGAMLTFRCKTCYNRLQRISITRAVFMSEEWKPSRKKLLLLNRPARSAFQVDPLH